jgi:hypothetical protein
VAIAYVQAPAAATVFSGTTISLAFGSNVTAGSMLCAHINANHGISGVADSRSQTYTSAVNVTDGATYSLATYYFLNTTGWCLHRHRDLCWGRHLCLPASGGVQWGGHQ